jgi:hypothetical protein
MKFLKIVVLLVLALAAAGVSYASNQASPAYGVSSVQDHKVPVDGAGVAFRTDGAIGWKVFEDTGSGSAVLLTDEFGNAPVCGVLHALCITAGSNYAMAVDSNTAAGVTTSAINNLLPALQAQSSVITCQTVDAQFDKGVVLINSSSSGGSYAYWRPCRGGRN